MGAKSVCTITLTAPEGAVIEQVEEETFGEIKSFKINDLELQFSPGPHMGFPISISEYTQVNNPNIDNLYLITYEDQNNNKEFVTNVYFTEKECNPLPEDNNQPPCAVEGIIGERPNYISVSLQEGSSTDAVKIMETMNFECDIARKRTNDSVINAKLL